MDPSAPKTRAPAGSTDTHFHIFGPKDKYPLSPHRMYDPADADTDRYLRMAKVVGIERMVIVNGSPYGSDNRCILDAIETFGQHRSRGVAVVDQDITDKALHDLYARGIRGIRFNLITGTTTMEDLKKMIGRLADHGMHAQFWIKSQVHEDILGIIDDVTVPVVLDHMGQVPTSLGMDHPHFQNMMRLLDTGKVWVKMIGYRVSGGPPFDDLRAPVAEIMSRIPDQMVWGTDWPHPLLKGMQMPDDGKMLDLLASWCDEAQLKKILVDNPARLYGF
jgi:predicted TIM-barrel fold metal-dependent hydrolase